ncbi:hypothetical protein [Mesorhizobium sp. M0296]|uniref:hypothetical protein n=1 Tax=Mesorhizobium sp. M0296 TaxID=2956931 RepID=UPI00333796C8
MPVTLYTHERYYRDNGNTQYGRWSENKIIACRGDGYGIGYDSGMYSIPAREHCNNGGPVMSMTRISGAVDPKFEKMKEALEKDPNDPGASE